MHMMLSLAGLIALVAGMALLAFGIPEFRSDLANPLLVSASVAILGGLMLIGLGVVALRLRRLTELLEMRPVPRSLGPGAGSGPQSGAIAAVSPSLESPIENPEKPGQRPRSEQQSQDVPLAAMQQPGPAVASSLVPVPPTDIPPPLTLRATRTAHQPAVQLTPVTEWPHVAPTDRLVSLDAPTAEIQPAWSEDEEHPDAPHLGAERELATAEEAQPTLLKSGVIDGMAYTLYSDGSVEAELPQGTTRFASIAEWRVYMRPPS